MEGMGDLIIVLSIFASIAGLWFRFSAARAEKRALAMLRSNPQDREPGLSLEVLATTSGMEWVEIRITNPASSWNLVAALALESCGSGFPAESRENKDLEVPFVIQANGSVSARFYFRTRNKQLTNAAIVLVDLDFRRVERQLAP